MGIRLWYANKEFVLEGDLDIAEVEKRISDTARYGGAVGGGFVTFDLPRGARGSFYVSAGVPIALVSQSGEKASYDPVAGIG